MKKYSLIIVDDHTLFRSGMQLLLENFEILDKIYEAANGQEFLDMINKNKIDIAFMDIDMPVMDGVEATIRSVKLFPDLKIIALSMYGEEQYYYKMIHAGVRGFLLKNSDISEVKNAIQAVSEGGNYFSQDILYNIVRNLSVVKNKASELTERESEVLYYICKGLSNAEIAEVLNINKRTIDKHRENLLSKTQSKNTASLIMYALKNKLITG